jgi:hypothetical protein
MISFSIVKNTRYLVPNDDSLHDDDGCHGLNNRYGTGQDARIVSTFGGKDTGRSIVLDGLLFLRDRGRGFEANPGGV